MRLSVGLGHLIEFTTATPLNGPLAGRTTGTVNPGHLGEPLSPAGVEAIIPMAAHSGRDPRCARRPICISPIFPEFYAKAMFGN
jgi:hypothetical protein